MSRIGKLPITLPANVDITIAENNAVTVKGPKGSLTTQVDRDIIISKEDGSIVVTRPTEQKRHKSMHGLYRSLINNMVLGVSEGYKESLELIGV
ncbi:MAG: ribosomal protein, partial [Adhaeribacter sp.]|nr:ribosomal protein [Adhaeribacter sp.]